MCILEEMGGMLKIGVDRMLNRTHPLYTCTESLRENKLVQTQKLYSFKKQKFRILASTI